MLIRQKRDMIHALPQKPNGFEQISDARIVHHSIADTGIREEIAHQQQRDKLRHSNGNHKQGTPEPGALRLFVVDEHCQKHAAEEGREGCKERPDQCPAQHLAECIAEGHRQRLTAKQRSKVCQPYPCKQRGRRHVLLVVVRKGNGNQNEERYNGKHHHAQHRQRQQRDIKFLIKVAVDVLTEAVGLFTGSLLLLQQVIRLHDHHSRHDQRDNDHQRNDAEQQNSKRVIVIVDLVFEGHRVELHLHLDSAERAKLF